MLTHFKLARSLTSIPARRWTSNTLPTPTEAHSPPNKQSQQEKPQDPKDEKPFQDENVDNQKTTHRKRKEEFGR